MFQHLIGAIGKSKMKLTWPLNSRRVLSSRKKVHTCTHVHTHTHSTIQCPWRYRFWGSECTQEEDIVANPFGSSAVHMTKVWISHPGSWWAGLSSLIRDQANENTAVLYLPSLGHVAPEAAMMGEGEGSRAERFLGVSTSLLFPLHYQNKVHCKRSWGVTRIKWVMAEWQLLYPQTKTVRCCGVSAPESQQST